MAGICRAREAIFAEGAYLEQGLPSVLPAILGLLVLHMYKQSIGLAVK